MNQSDDSKHEVLTINELAELLQISPNTAYKMASNGEIPGRKIGKSMWRFSRLLIHLWLWGKYKDDLFKNVTPQTFAMIHETTRQSLTGVGALEDEEGEGEEEDDR